MKLHQRTWAVVAIAGVLLCLSVIGVAVWRAQRALNRAESDLAAGRNLAVTVHAIAAQPNPGFVAFATPAVFRSAAEFNGRFYLSGPAGLFAYSLTGELQHIYRVGLDLPAAPLGPMRSGTLADANRPELLIATHGAGVLAFDGQSFRQILPADAESRQITALLPLPSGRLLLGTAKRGLLVYDGKSLRRFHSTTNNVFVTALAGAEADLWIGTLTHGILHWHGGQMERIDESQGLPDPRVEAIAQHGVSIYVGTPVGVAEIRAGRVVRVLAPGRYAHALQPIAGMLLVGEFEGGILPVSLAGTATPSLRRAIVPRSPADNSSSQPASAGSLPADTPVEQFLTAGSTQYALTSDSLLRREPDGDWRRVLATGGALLTDRDISALMVGADGRLWVGYFDRGLDILPATGGPPAHIENDRIFCVNRILDDAPHGAVAVATANGLVMFDRDGRQRQVLDRNTGLISSHVTDVALYGDGLAAATPAGITFLDASGTRSIYAFQGLVNNHVYALAARGSQLLAGTLGGLSILSDGAVRRNLTTATSGLKSNWITGVAPAGSDWLLGTYGAGIFRLQSDGSITPTSEALNGTIVNENAMLTDGRLTLAGTLGRGLLVGDASGTHWRTITAGLPSLNVTALAIDKGIVYVGTDNGLVKISASNLE